ncbi:helix-hairpin-helix domain-containing protein [Flavobacteriaceae bacterium F89]|uniref:Helix-hairpin-helix domain-containing protein n=1 Tax=Cerina litoralis TaxID=2874477 RepID=A0AAE3JMB4_9FLAO|nr:helix-hairpin-helix domain-containing protein [Cerina litoralis]MCG2459645.1 helix-hairpin-helix domain-containing protein [Cerina litoralis]
MGRKDKKSQIRFSRQERSGIFFLLSIIVLLQIGYFVFGKVGLADDPTDAPGVDLDLQAKIDSLKNGAIQKDSIKIYPFNPNFITDYKGYALGMSVQEIDRLFAFRKHNKFVNSPEEFQRVTEVSDSLLDAISPYFKFPEWTQVGKRSTVGRKQYATPPNSNGNTYNSSSPGRLGGDITIKDLNTATVEELKSISGIGDKLSARIVKFRDLLGGFVVDAQLFDVYGLSPEVVERTLERYRVLTPPKINKTNMNTASASELAKLVYISYKVGQRIVDYRTKVGTIKSYSELTQIEDFPSDKIDRIKLYLAL